MKTQIDAMTRNENLAEYVERRFVMYNVGWEGYQGLLKIIGDGLPRVTYADGDMELMKPMLLHERYRNRLKRVVSIVTEECDLPCISLGSTTFHRQDRDCGLEPDECYYLANAGRIGGEDSIDLAFDPPPDLAIDIQITTEELDEIEIYARLGFPELWRFDGETLTTFRRNVAGRYDVSESSLCFSLPPDERRREVGPGSRFRQ